MYAENHNYGTYEAETGSGMDTTYTLYDKDTVARLLKGNPDLLPAPSVKISKDERWNRQHIQSAVLSGILQGESMKGIADRFQQVVGMDERAAMRNARTAVTGAENAGRIDSYLRAQSLGIRMKQVWMSTLDGRTRDSHAMMDGEKVDVGETFSNGCRYPGDPEGAPAEIYNCRCTLVAEVEGSDAYNGAARPSEYLEDQGLTYEQWKQMHSKKPSTYEQQIANLKQSGKLTAENIMKAGELTMAEFDKEYQRSKQELDNKIQNEVDEMNNMKIALQNSERGSKEAADLVGSLRKKIDDVKALLSSREEVNAQSLKNTLSRVRSMGVKDEKAFAKHFSNPKSVMVPFVRRAYDIYPTSWVELSVNAGKLTVVKAKRGYYKPSESRMAIKDEKNRGLNFRTAIHELGHRFEDIVPDLLQEVNQFYNKRTAGEPLVKLRNVTGNNKYGDDEETRVDNFIHPYMGKDYGGSGYELISLGFEYLYTDPSKFDKDPDMKTWLIGLLTLL